MKEELIKQEAAIEVACALPKATGREIALASKHAMTPRAVNMARKRKTEKRDDFSLEKIISKKHHLLINNGQKSSSLEMT